jgi:cell division protein FtsW (lipid II flippase)
VRMIAPPVPLAERTALNWLTPAWLCVIAGLGLSLLGIYSIDLGADTRTAAAAPGLSALAARQAVFLGVGLLAAGLVIWPHARVLRMLAWPALAVCILLLLVLLLPFVPSWLVAPRKGVRGWIDLGPLDLQPAEFAKIAFTLAAADYLRYRKNHRTVLGLLPPAILTFIPVGLIVLQPDMGTALMFVPAIFAMLVAAGARVRHMLMVVIIGLCAAPASYPLLHDYQKQRIIGLLAQFRGEKHTSDDLNYQAYTAQTVLGAGGLTGLPEAHSRAVIRYAELPERHNDMIFAVIVNRFGLVGGIAVLAAYGLWLGGALLAAAACREAFGRLVIVGLSAILAVQAVINIGMVIGLLPIVGLTLPFVSYGGSSMLAMWLTTAVVVSISLRPPPRLSRPGLQFDD